MRDTNFIVKCFERFLTLVWSQIPIHFLDFKKKYSDSNDINRAFNCNRALFKITFNAFSERKFLNIDSLFKIIKILDLEISTSEIIYHWCASISMSTDDFIKKRYESCDFNE